MGLPALTESSLGLSSVHRVSPAVPLPAILVVVSADGPVFSVGDGRDPVGGHTEVHKEALGRGRAPVAQAQVVLLAAALVAMAFDGELDVRVRLQEVGVTGQGLLGVRANIVLVKVEVGVLYVGRERLFLAHLRRRGRRRRRRRHGYRDPSVAVAGPARTGHGHRVGRRLLRRHAGGALGLLFAGTRLEVVVRGILGGPAQRYGLALVYRCRLRRQSADGLGRLGRRGRRRGRRWSDLFPVARARQNNHPHYTGQTCIAVLLSHRDLLLSGRQLFMNFVDGLLLARIAPL